VSLLPRRTTSPRPARARSSRAAAA
jgi:hypothetical protein